jgi:hypothetical protein
VLANYGDVRGLVTTAVADANQRARLLTRLSLDLRNVHDAARELLNICITDQFASSPTCWLEAILIKVNVGTQSPLLQTAIARLHAKQMPPSTAFDKAWLNQVPFFDRTMFRQLVRTLITTTNLPVLRVNGPPGCGCTYTARALEEIAREYAEHITVLTAEIPASQATVYSVEDLVGDLLALVPGALPLPPRTSSSYPGQLVRHTLNQAASQCQTLIFVIDGAGLQDVNDEIRLFAAGLAKEICRMAARPRARLLLINHQQRLSVQAFDMRDEIVPDPAALQEADLERCLVDMEACRIAAGGAKLPAPAKEIAKLLLADAPADPRTRLEHLNGRLVAIFGS